MLDVAIVGMGCRLPGNVHGPKELWDFLLSRGDGIVEVPEDRWRLDRYYDADPDMPGRMYTRKAGFLQDSLWNFDPEFFGISPREASIMDPQQRLLLEVTQEALDDAGVSGRVAGRQVGVYIGGFTADNLVLRHLPSTRAAANSHSATAASFTMLSNRLSYVYDLRGPSMTIDTACSSSLVALHQATQAMAAGAIEMALVGGVNAMLTPEMFINMCRGRFLAVDGHCKTFDADADGYARGEGAGILVLKPLADATRDNDRVYAVIRATGVNQDGRTQGITVPNPEAQAELVRRVTAEAGLRPEQIGYVEAHGTGTAVGDPLEMSALGAALGRVDGRTTDLVVGSIKNSIGHLEAAAGVVGVIKAALTLHHRTIAPQASLNRLNPAIPFEEHRLRVVTEAEPFPAEYPFAAVSVNGFGYGGTNAHAVLVEPPAPAAPAPRQAAAQVLPISGRNEAGARQLAKDLLPLVADESVDPASLVDSLWSRRAHHHNRFAVPFGNRAELVNRLTAVVEGTVAGGRTIADGDAPVFVYSGMGPQWWRMGRDLLDAGGPFARAAAEVDEIFTDLAGWSVIDEMRRDETDSRITSTEIAQPANFLLQVGLTAELAHYGVQPAAIVGHSVGEVTAAHVSGMLSLVEATKVSYHRSRLQALTAGTGGMLAVGLSEQEALEWITGRVDVCIAAVNSPSGVTLAGTWAAIAELNDQLTSDGVFARQLRVEVPYHSHLMDPILPALTEALADLDPQIPTVPLYSTVTHAQVTEPNWGAQYWCDNVREPVRFADAITTLVDAGEKVFLEVGPHPVLSGNIKEILLRKSVNGTSIATLSRATEDSASVRSALAELYVAGALGTDRAPGSSEAVPAQQPLPTHRFQRVELWSLERSVTEDYLGTTDARALPGDQVDAGSPQWETELAAARLPWLRDHVVAGLVVLPGAAYLDAALAAAAQTTAGPVRALDDVRFVTPLLVENTQAPTLRLSLEASRFTISSQGAPSASWIRHATGRVVDGAFRPKMALTDIAGATIVTAAVLYPRLAERGLAYGPAFQRIIDAQVSADRVLARVDATGAGIAASNHQAHPTVLDAALQCVALLGGDVDAGAVVPAAVRHVRQYADLPEQVLVGVALVEPEPGEAQFVADVVITDPIGEVLVELHRVQFRPITPPAPVLGELDRLWLEPVFEERSARDEMGSSAALAGEHAFVIAAGEESVDWASRHAAQRGARKVITVHGDDPEQICAHVQTELVIDPDDSRPTVITLVAAAGGERTPNQVLRRLSELPAMLVGVARAIQNLQDEAFLDGFELPLHGLVITQGALAGPGSACTELPDLATSTLIGVRRVLRNEQSQLEWRLIDVDRDTTPAAVVLESLVSANYADDVADEVALRGDRRLVITYQPGLAERLAELDVVQPLLDPEANFEIDAPHPGRLADLALRQIPRPAPGPGDIELRMEGIGLNFKDPMKVLGVLGENELAGTHFGTSIGMEGLGVVTRIGPGVDGITVGEARFVGAPGMARRYVVTAAENGSTTPGHGLSLDAYGSIVVLMTAHYALVHAARIEPGEWVLITGGAGGVGMAAVQVAARAGARVIATASNPERAQALRDLGAEYVLDSRSLSAIEEVRELTGGHGADVVVSAAPGEAVVTNLEVAAEFGRVVEVGKTEIFGKRLIDMAVFNKNLSLISIDLDRMMAHRKDMLARVNGEVLNAIREGHYTLLPTRIMPVSQLADAFDQVARSAHLGRIVLDFTEPAPPVKPQRPVTAIRADGAYLVTGGLGDFGLATAAWLAGRDAGTIVLGGRRGAASAEQQAAVAALRAGGADVRVEQVDVADRASVDALLSRMSGGLPLRGVFHAAGVLADEPLGVLSRQGLHRVLAAKAAGALHLDAALAGTDLDMFVLYSSVTSQAGTVPQISYAAANAMLDTLAHHRSSRGLPALSVNWGSLSGGMAAASEAISTYLALNGLRPIPLSAACEYLDAAIALDPVQVAITDIDLAVWGPMHPASASTPRYAAQVEAARAGNAASGSVRTELATMSLEERVEVLTRLLTEQVAGVLGVPGDTVDWHTPLPELGLDSLMAVELRARVNVALEVEISALELNRSGGVSTLASRLADQLATPL